MKTPLPVFVLLLLPAPIFAQEKPEASTASSTGDDKAKARIVERLNDTVIPQINFTQATLVDIAKFLQIKPEEIEDREEVRKPMKFAVKADAGKLGEARVTLRLVDVPLSEVLRYTADAAGARFELNADGTIFLPSDGDTPPNASLLPAKVQEEHRKLLEAKLDKIIIPQIAFTQAHVPDVVEFFRRDLIEYDKTEADPTRKGINIVSLGESNSKAWNKQISMKDTNISLRKALEQMAKLAGMKITVDPYAVVIEPDPEAEK